jgi:hypothetical protein
VEAIEELTNMKRESLAESRGWKRAAKAVLGALLTVFVTSGTGCLNRPVEPIEPLTTSTIVERLTQSAVNKIDILLDVDNSSSMADKQAILALAVPLLVSGLVNPSCLDDATMTPLPAAMQPTTPTAACPTGSEREFPPVLDIHIGLVSSSLGTFGADGCPEPPPPPPPPTVCMSGATDDNNGHLVTRSDPCGQDPPVPTFQDEGFLAWNPSQGAPSGTIGTIAALNTAVTSLVIGDGQLGCGFESQNESWYRFLVDPAPYQSIQLVNDNAVSSGIDDVLLQQRADFLRPDSLLAIINVTDETDTSIKEFSVYPLFGETYANNVSFHLPRATAACTVPPPALGPLDPCCASCGGSTPTGCTPDPACTGESGEYTDATEAIPIRAFGLSGGLMSHKARYGIEFFYQPSRYVNALTSSTVADNAGNIVPNPLYTILPGNDPTASVRDPSLVFYAAVTGVPWQLIARQDANGKPDLLNGLDTTTMPPTPSGGFKSGAELGQLDPTGKNTFWQDIAGNPENYVPPISPFMQESTVPRSGVDPITGTPISPVTATSLNPINGHERTLPIPPNDIEYACIFPLLTPRDCTKEEICDCPSVAGTVTDNPLCDPTNSTSQINGKAYPGVKNLAIAEGMGTQGIAASICPAQLTDPTQADYGYTPAIGAIIDRLKKALGGQCLPRTLTPDATGEVSCLILEAQVAPAGEVAACNACPAVKNGVPTARQPVSAEHEPAVAAAEYPADPDGNPAWNCFCEIAQTSGTLAPGEAAGGQTDLEACQTETGMSVVNTTTTQPVNGWCYVDATIVGPNMASAAALTKNCPETEKRLIRFVGTGNPVDGSTLFITCTGQ